MMKGHLATATEGNIRGRLVSHFEGEMSVGSTVRLVVADDSKIRLEGKMRYHEHNYPLTDATTITWFASRSVSSQSPCDVAWRVDAGGDRSQLLPHR